MPVLPLLGQVQTTQPASADVLPWFNLLIATSAFVVGAFTYRYNVKTRHAEWLTKLYDKFYESPSLKQVRDWMDCDVQCASDDLRTLVKTQDARYTDYLNFFEYVALLYAHGHLSLKEVDAMFGYYLRCLARHKDVHYDIESETMGFEYLRKLLRRLMIGHA